MTAAAAPGSPEKSPDGAWRLDADADDVGRGLARLVLAVLELLRELLERQAVRRMEAGSLTDDEVERLGQALLALRDRLTELREVFGVRPQDLGLPKDVLAAIDSRVGGEPGAEADSPETDDGKDRT